MFSKVIRVIGVLCVLAGLQTMVSCSEKEFDPADPKKSFGIAKEPYDEESYERAVTKLSEFKARFPYSQFAIEAELLIANSHFQLGHYPEAAVTYEQFAKLHPKHAQVEYALYRAGESYWSDAPEEIDREQSLTQKAIDAWTKLAEKFPDGQQTRKAKELMTVGRTRIARSEEFVMDFYCKQEIYHACAYRAQKLAEKFPELVDLRRKALSTTAKCFDILADQKEKDPESDKNLYFKTMTSAQLRERATELRRLAAK